MGKSLDQLHGQRPTVNFIASGIRRDRADMELPRISIVTISFNQAQFLRATIDSVLDQNYPNLQYIIADPGSKDGSRDIIDSYGSKIDVKLYEPDSGPADGLKKGFAHADGEILGFLNSDDILLPNALLTVGKLFAENSNVDVISGHCHVIDEHGGKLRESYSDRFIPFVVLHRAANLMQPSTFFRRSTYEKTNGFNPSNRYDWDTELWLDMHAAGAKFMRTNAMFSGYRVHQASITNNQGKGRLIVKDDHKKLLERKRGRQWAWFDHPLRWGCLVFKYLGNPRSIRERLLRGPVAGRY